MIRSLITVCTECDEQRFKEEKGPLDDAGREKFKLMHQQFARALNSIGIKGEIFSLMTDAFHGQFTRSPLGALVALALKAYIPK